MFEYGDPRLKLSLAMRDGLECFFCGHQFSNTMEGWSYMSVDHLKSRSQNAGNDTVDSFHNMVLSCRTCNSIKGEKSFERDGEELRLFKMEMVEYKKTDTIWTEMNFEFIQNERNKGSREWPNIKEGVISHIQKNNTNFTVTPYNRDNERAWLEISRPVNKHRKWYFHTVNFYLNPYFIPKYSKDLLKDPRIRNLKNRGYLFWNGLLIKYLEPFNKLEINRGVESLIKEINEVEEMWFFGEE